MELEPRLRPGTIVIANDLKVLPEQLANYRTHVRDPANGWLSVELPIDDGLELSIRLG